MDSIQQLDEFKNIPAEIKQLKQWVLWKFDNHNGKITKPPVDAAGKLSNATNPATWYTFNEAITKIAKGKVDGIGIALGNGLSGTDLDDCIKTDGTLTSDAIEIINLLSGTYIEYSPSGRGLHLLHWGKKPVGSKNKVKMQEMKCLECYDQGRYFTVTGRVYGDAAKPLLDMTTAIAEVCRRYLSKNEQTTKKEEKVLSIQRLTDDQIIARIQRSKDDKPFSSLCSGDTSVCGGDHSAADAKLIEILLFYSNGDKDFADRYFRLSGLMRPKWEEEHSSDGLTYGEMTTNNIDARLSAEGKYNWKTNKPLLIKADEIQVQSEEISDLIEELQAVPFPAEQTKFYYENIISKLAQLPPIAKAQAIGDIAEILKVSKTDVKADLKKISSYQSDNTTPQNIKQKIPPVYNEWLDKLKGTEYDLDSIGNFGYYKTTENGDKVFMPMANFIAAPIKEIIRDNGQESTLLFEIAGLLLYGVKLPIIQVDANKFSSLSWVMEKWGIKPNIKSGSAIKDKLRNAIQSMIKGDIQRSIIYEHIGWRKIHDQWVYLHAGGAIGAGTHNITVDITEGIGQNELSSYVLEPPASDLKTAIQTSLSILDIAPASITYPLMSEVYLSPLCDAMRRGVGSEPSFLLWLYGQSGCMKSTLAAICLDHFGVFSNKTFPASFKDTALNIEKKGFILKDSLMVIDDYYPVTSVKEAQRMEAIAQSIARGWGDRTGRGRLQSDTKMKAGYVPKGMVLVTGEDLPGIGQSGTARMISIEMKAGDIDKSRLSYLQANTKLLNNAMRGYIEWLQPQMEELPQRFKQEFNCFRQQVVESGQHARLIEAEVWLYIGFNMFMEYALTNDAITEEQANQYREIAWNTLLRAAQEQAIVTEEDKPVTKFINAINELVATRQKNLMPITFNPLESDGSLYTESIGYFDDEFCYLLPGQTYSAVVEFYKKQGTRFPVSDRMLWKHLKNAGIIIIGNDGKSVRQKKINGKNARYIWLYKKYLEVPEMAEL